MATHSRILAGRIPIDRGACSGRKELDITEQLSPAQENDISTQTGIHPWQNPGQDLRNPGSILCFKIQYQMLLLVGWNLFGEKSLSNSLIQILSPT